MTITDHAAVPARSIADWQAAIHQYARDKGWWDRERSFGELCALITCEVSEAFEAYRDGASLTETFYAAHSTPPGKPEGVPSELADIVIRVLDLCGAYGIDLEAILAEKHAYNLTRQYRHGGKLA